MVHSLFFIITYYIYILMLSVFPPRDHHVKTFQSQLLKGWGCRHCTLWNNWGAVQVSSHVSWKEYTEWLYFTCVVFLFGVVQSISFFLVCFIKTLHKSTIFYLPDFYMNNEGDENLTSGNKETESDHYKRS